MREVRGLWNTLYSSKFAVSLPLKFCSFTKFFSHAKSCTLCAKAKAACKPFDADRARTKTRAVMGIKRFNHETKVNTRSERRNL